MVQNIRCTSQRALLLALILLAVQCYALYMNTRHVFHDMPPMCQFCATVGNYQNSAVNTVAVFYEPYRAKYIEGHLSRRLTPLFVKPHYQSRAPPFPLIVIT